MYCIEIDTTLCIFLILPSAHLFTFFLDLFLFGKIYRFCQYGYIQDKLQPSGLINEGIT